MAHSAHFKLPAVVLASALATVACSQEAEPESSSQSATPVSSAAPKSPSECFSVADVGKGENSGNLTQKAQFLKNTAEELSGKSSLVRAGLHSTANWYICNHIDAENEMVFDFNAKKIEIDVAYLAEQSAGDHDTYNNMAMQDVARGVRFAMHVNNGLPLSAEPKIMLGYEPKGIADIYAKVMIDINSYTDLVGQQVMNAGTEEGARMEDWIMNDNLFGRRVSETIQKEVRSSGDLINLIDLRLYLYDKALTDAETGHVVLNEPVKKVTEEMKMTVGEYTIATEQGIIRKKYTEEPGGEMIPRMFNAVDAAIYAQGGEEEADPGASSRPYLPYLSIFRKLENLNERRSALN